MKELIKRIVKEKDQVIALRRDLHKHPELAFEEFRTAGIVSESLMKFGLEVQTNVASTGVVGILEGAKDGPTVLVRCDMDALPISEETGAEFSSINTQKMHACGHDGHTAIGVTVAKVLANFQETIYGRIKFVFQPAQETGLGARTMIAENVLENPNPDMFLGIHLWNELPLGQVAVVPGPVMAGCDNFTVKIQGRGGHAALPDQTYDPIMAMVQTISNLQTIISRNISSTKTAVISVTRIDAGENYNIIPDSVTFYGTIRTFDTTIREHVIARFHKIVEQTAELMDCSAQIEVKQMAPPVINDVDLANKLYRRFQQTMPDLEYLNTFQVMASEDAAFFLERIPGVFILVGSANSERNLDYPHHHPKFDFDEESLVIGASLIAIAVSEFLGARDS